MSAWQHLYSSRQWKQLRRHQLAFEPLCRFCLDSDVVEAATVVDHVKPHKGDEALFYDADNLQSLCKPCHDGTKQRIELGQDVVTFGADGWPLG
ncbi:HNH endonuclease [Bradyrhizobium yuanmingense]|uniref:HNH endonuclease n=1 Tax=Bradyrhizobium yuanmingense TaxID=108015 RepID=UPI000FE4271E|nr:HNH endonuclease signature motif containing protein [Bradyrhizobium yuanmingense]TGN80501.1 HNH endonuclease [Bradyrhizobium yuanmingense]